VYRIVVLDYSAEDATIHPNMNTLFGALFGTEANTKRIFGTSLIDSIINIILGIINIIIIIVILDLSPILFITSAS